jgi:hypothetical protein
VLQGVKGGRDVQEKIQRTKNKMATRILLRWKRMFECAGLALSIEHCPTPISLLTKRVVAQGSRLTITSANARSGSSRRRPSFLGVFVWEFSLEVLVFGSSRS